MFSITDLEDGRIRIAWPQEHDLKKVLRALCSEVYAHSHVRGMGILHFQEGGLPEEEFALLWRLAQEVGRVRMDYVLGRCCKFFAELDEPDADGLILSMVIDHRGFMYDHPEAEWLSVLSNAERRVWGSGIICDHTEWPEPEEGSQ